MDGAVWDHYLKFKGQKHPEATNEFNEMLQDQLLYEEYYKWAQHSKMDNEVDFIRAVDALLQRSACLGVSRAQRCCNCGELVQGSLQILDDLGCNHLRSRQVAGVLQ